MRVFAALLLLVVMQCDLSGMTWAADAHVFGTFALFEMNKGWGKLSDEDREKGGQEAKALLESFKNQVTVDAYWTWWTPIGPMG